MADDVSKMKSALNELILALKKLRQHGSEVKYRQVKDIEEEIDTWYQQFNGDPKLSKFETLEDNLEE